MADGYHLYVDLRYIGCIIRVVEKIRIDKIIGVRETSYTYWLGQSRIRTEVYGFADHRLNHSSNRPNMSQM